jgi:nicotinamidase-related amidase
MEKVAGRSPNLLSREETLLVIIDAQERLMPVIAGREEVTENILRLARFAGIANLPAVVTEQEKLGPTVTTLAGALGDFKALSKAHFNCFFNDAFRAAVEGAGRRSLILCGVEAHICVAQTALYALPAYEVHVVDDAVSSRTTGNKAVAIERMRQAGAVITSTEMVIYELLRQAGTAEFKEALKLVK